MSFLRPAHILGFLACLALFACGEATDVAGPGGRSLQFVQANISLNTNNRSAYQQKYNLISQATQSIDMAYYIFDRDFSSSHFVSKLLEKANQGIRIRILVDWLSTVPQQDFLRMLEAKGGGNLHVAYFRPPLFPNDC